MSNHEAPKTHFSSIVQYLDPKKGISYTHLEIEIPTSKIIFPENIIETPKKLSLMPNNYWPNLFTGELSGQPLVAHISDKPLSIRKIHCIETFLQDHFHNRYFSITQVDMPTQRIRL